MRACRPWLLLVCLAVVHAAEVWRPTTWAGGPAWAASVGEATAVVALSAGRLIRFGPGVDGNLLYVPEGGAIRVYEAVLHGGHQAWLGPQERWNWPPPPAWESPAIAADIAGDEITLRLPAGDAKGPGLVRRYRVVGDRLRCEVAWSDARPWHVMHVMQVPRAMRIEPLQAPPTAALPTGLQCRMERLGDALPPGSSRDGATVHLVPGKAGAKVFLPAQVVRGVLDGWTLELRPGTAHGRDAGEADHGLQTQIYLSPDNMPYLELEQCSGLLLPGEDGTAGVAMELRVVKLND